MKILIADDDAVSRRLLRQTLENWGHEVLVACDGREALETFLDHPIRIVITDWMMPHLDGPGLCQAIVEHQRGASNPAYVILLTSRDSTSDLAHGLGAGANDFIPKPFKTEELRARLRNGERILALQDELIRAREEMRRLAMTDPLTGLFNRRAMLQSLRRDEERMRRERRPLGVVMVDLDYFKQINDRHGHLAGDRVLERVASSLEACIRGGDYVGRWGGEEFLLVLPGADAVQCAEVAERCRRLIESQRIRLDDGLLLRISASFGAASTEGPDRVPYLELVQQADEALYWAKEAGRNQVKLFVGERADA